MTKSKLPRFPPRKARNTPTLIKFMVRWLDKFQFLPTPIPAKSPYNLKSRLNLLLLTAIDRTSISRKARDLRERQIPVPSGETTLAWLKRKSVKDITLSQHSSFQHFLNSLPKHFQRVRRQGMMLAIDFHTDPNYAKTLSAYICKDRRKASTHQFYKYLTVIWINAPEPITLAVQLITSEHSVFETVQNILTPLIRQEEIIGVLGDGDFYNWDIVKWLMDNQIFFVIRGRVNSGVKPLVQIHQKMLKQRGSSIIVNYRMNKGHTRKRLPVKLVLYQLGRRIMALIVPTSCNLTGRQIHSLYRKRFTIETYYRQMHRFQIFSCSKHSAVRFILVLVAFWLCNFWAYFKSPLEFLKSTSRHCHADFVYTANDFCEFIRFSWHQTIFTGQVVFSRR